MKCRNECKHTRGVSLAGVDGSLYVFYFIQCGYQGWPIEGKANRRMISRRHATVVNVFFRVLVFFLRPGVVGVLVRVIEVKKLKRKKKEAKY